MATVCGSTAASRVSCTIAHWPTKRLEPLAPLARPSPRRTTSASSAAASLRVGEQRSVVGEPRVGGELGPAERSRTAAASTCRPGGSASDDAADRPWSRSRRPAGSRLSSSGGRRPATACRAAATAPWPGPSPTGRCPSSDTSTIGGLAGALRWNSAPMIPPAIVIAPIESPKPGTGRHRHQVVLGPRRPDRARRHGPRRPASRTSPCRRPGRARPVRCPHVDDAAGSPPGSRSTSMRSLARTAGACS